MNLGIESSGYSTICCYQENELLRKSFNELAIKVFGIDFEDWYQKGYWDENYVCHSIVKDKKVISNVSISKMNLMISGKNKSAIQIGTVMTHPDFRGNGLSRQLMNHVLETYQDECEVFYLFANDSVHHFYPKFGFTAMSESHFSMKVSSRSLVDNGLRKLNCAYEKDQELLKRILQTRSPISNQFGISNNQGIFMFYALNVFPDDIYFFEEYDAIIVYQNEGDILQLYDVVSQHKVDFTDLLSHISNINTETIHFHFTPDRFAEKVNYEPKKQSDLLFIKSKNDWNIKTAFCAPMLSHA
ncbi:GNAT family acetyltransferase [Paenibacillus baekrokdamisoli]|uniref:GNAT family acetyltransferase n=1 Tax=Paenibacillus baekrokdamisoli TaxID=1712516 RepID=A0A3G9JH89_9BACL|nr:GNAT family N-acetyltransferase [Paenibacillus baekrokdamisoli]MBB3073171.1 putative GNAT family N-acyltransferase [Paenibacillus baekrokdamisoli]BBH24323.1 GNAT family acetyltransferase [Paenibacillus baekrokdamisoli]